MSVVCCGFEPAQAGVKRQEDNSGSSFECCKRFFSNFFCAHNEIEGVQVIQGDEKKVSLQLNSTPGCCSNMHLNCCGHSEYRVVIVAARVIVQEPTRVTVGFRESFPQKA